MISEKMRRTLIASEIVLVLTTGMSLIIMWKNAAAIIIFLLLALITALQLKKEKQRPSDEREYFSMFVAGYFGWLFSMLFVFILGTWEYIHTGNVSFWFKPMVIATGLSFFVFSILFKARIWD